MENVTQLAPGTLWTRGVKGRSTDDGAVAGAGGGTGIDSNLTPPVLALAVAGNVYPPQLDATLDVTWITGDKIRLQSCADISFGTTIINDLHTITNAEVLAGSISYGALLSGIISPTVTWFRARGEHAAGNSNWSNIVVHGDVTAPTITSSSAISVNENTVLAHTLTANESIYSWTNTGGVDSAQFEIAGTTLRWLGNGTKNYEAPNDTGSNNVYDVQVTATDYAGNSTNQNIAVTVNDLNENPTGLSGFFTDVTGATVSTLYTSANTYTVAGLATTVPITITGGSYSKNGAGYTSGAGTVQNGDTVQLQTTSSASAGVFQYVVVNIGGGTDTWSVKTAGTPALPTGAVFQFEADDLTTLFQNIAGSTAVTTSGQTVGKWNDKSGNGNNVAAAADDGTRPLYDLTSGISSVVADGTDDVLFKTAALNLWSAGAWTIVFAVKSSTAGGRTLIGEGNSGNATPFASYARSLAATSTSFANSLRNDANTNLSDPTVTLQTGVFDGTYHVIVLGDDGSGWTVWLDGVKGSKIASGYVRSGSLTLDRFSLFARVRPAISEYFGGNLQFACGYTRFLSDADASAASTYAGAKQGRTI